MNNALALDVKIVSPLFTKEDLPTYGTPGSAGLDLRACIEKPLTLAPGEVQLVPTGIAVHLGNPAYAALIMPRSGMGHKNGIILGNTIGLIDSDYQGELKMSLWNRSDKEFTIQPMDRVAQLVIVPVLQVQWNITNSFETSARGEGGFNSTGNT